MKTIEMTDEDYKDFITMVKELHTQDHDSQANPRMWTVDTTQERICKEGYSNYDGGDTFLDVYSSQSNSAIRLDNLKSELIKACKENSSLETLDEEYEDYIGSIEEFKNWCEESKESVLDVLEYNGIYKLTDYLETLDYIDVVPMEEYEKHELNATFFKSDAKNHIEFNKHNLGKNPHTYAFSVYRMPKMERLFNILNKLGEE